MVFRIYYVPINWVCEYIVHIIMFHLITCVNFIQSEDYRIIFVNTFEVHAYHIVCEVSKLMYIEL